MVDEPSGDPACWAHLFEDHERGVVVDLTDVRGGAEAGVVWSAASGDLNANLVRLGADDGIDEHRNDEVDVLVIVLTGEGDISIDDDVHRVTGQQLVLIPAGTRRSIRANEWGLTYLTVHRARGPLQIKRTGNAET
jgi:quercetin dioxygenase-like cupin family protein